MLSGTWRRRGRYRDTVPHAVYFPRYRPGVSTLSLRLNVARFSSYTVMKLRLRKHQSPAPQASSSKAPQILKTPSPQGSLVADSPDRPAHPTPSKKAVTSVSIPANQKQNLREMDGGRCLITRESKPPISIQACHILRRETADALVRFSSPSSLCMSLIPLIVGIL